VTYRALDERAEAIAAALAARGCGPGTVVASALAHGAELAAAMLGVFKAGATLLPLDARAPPERQRYLLEDSGACVVIVADDRSDVHGAVAHLSLAAIGDGTPPRRTSHVGLDAAAYVIYTSGSTGTPNGVVVAHAALAGVVQAVTQAYGLKSTDRVLQFASPAFDVALEEILPTLTSGACLVATTDADRLAGFGLEDLVRERAITVVNLPGQYWQRWISEVEWEKADLPSLRLVVAGSEEVASEALTRWEQTAPAHVAWCNAYGVTEATITSALYRAGARGPHRPPMPRA
jgi:non-ribosomal peptide synthetase component F